MKKQDIAIVVVLFGLLVSWIFLQNKLFPQAPRLPVPAAGVTASNGVPVTAAVPAAGIPSPEGTNGVAAVPVLEPARHVQDEKKIDLSNGVARVTVSSWGGGIIDVELSKYSASLARTNGAVIFSFMDKPALAFQGLPGFSIGEDFELSAASDGRSVRIGRLSDTKLRLERTITMGDGYRLEIEDTFRNESDVPASLPAYGMNLGTLPLMEKNISSYGTFIGLDTLGDTGGSEVHHWGSKELPGFFGYKASMMSCSRPDTSMLPERVSHNYTTEPLAWMAVKNKYFVQILAPESSASGCTMEATRSLDPALGFAIAKVSGALTMPERVLQPGGSLSRKSVYFMGPKEFKSLKPLGNHQDDVMEFGWWEWFRWLCKVLLWTLNGLYAMIPNYGVAIILLTLIVKILFWPITHKSTESMKRMQEVQPLVTALREKYKDKPEKINQEMMDLYRKHKVNPMAGCLPMLVQIPVFIALFVVLRSAVELRFAPFLWIKDLSEAENLLAGMMPFGLSLNILPLIMAGTQVWQQKLTPSTADPQQQKMMTLMPLVMLFIFYSMASGLVLYWTISQVLSIIQLLNQQKHWVEFKKKAD